MAWTTKDARLKLTPEEEAKTVGMDHYELIAYMHALEQDGTRAQGALIVPDAVNKSVFHELTPVEETQASAQPTIKIGDMSFTGTEQEIELQLKAYFESQQRQPAVADPPPARDPNTGRFARQDAQPSTTSAVDKVLNDQVAKAIEESTGASVDEIKQIVEERRGQLETQSWAEATEKFKTSPGGSSWPGGEVNQIKLAEVMRDTQVDGVLLMALPDKVQALQLAYDYMRENALIVKTPAVLAQERDAKAAADKAELEAKIAAAKTPQEIDDLTGRTARMQAALRAGKGSGQFGTR